MRIGILSQYYPPEIGAPQARLSHLARSLLRRGHEVYVLTAMPSYPGGRIYRGYSGIFRRECWDGVRVLRAILHPAKSAAFLTRMTCYCSFALSSAVAGTLALPTLDYLVTESPPLFLGFTGYLLSRLKGARWIFNVSDLWPESAVQLGAVSDGTALRAAYALEAFCYRKAWLVTGQSREIITNIRDRFSNVPVYLLSNGVDTKVFSPSGRRSEIRTMFGAGESDCVVLYSGLHGIAQGLDQVLDAAAELKGVREIRFVFIGDGPEKRRLVARANQAGLTNVRFLDPCASAAMPGIVASADVSLVPLKNHLHGAVPSKLYEAMGAGVAVLLAADGEAAEIVRNAGCGWRVPAGDAKGLAEGVRALQAGAELRAAMGARGRAAAMHLFDRNAISDRFVDLLEKERHEFSRAAGTGAQRAASR